MRIASVRPHPTLALHDVLKREKPQLPPQLNNPGVSFWFSGRVAIYQAVRALGLRAGDAVALPAFCCGSEVDPIVEAGLVPRFYRLTKTMDPEPESFETALEGCVAALATHYFGFTANLVAVRESCASKGVPLIEDCAHALYSRDDKDWLGAGADVAIFSMMKTLPIPDGGAMRFALDGANAQIQTCEPPSMLVAKRSYSLLIRHLQAHPNRALSYVAHLPRAIKNLLRDANVAPLRDTDAGLEAAVRFDQRFAASSMSRWSKRLLASSDHVRVRNARRQNYQRIAPLVDGIKGIDLLFSHLPEQTCPLALPIIASNPEAFRHWMSINPSLGVQQMWPWFHPGIAWKQFPFEADLKHSMFIFPVHQSLHENEIDRIIESLQAVVEIR